MQLLIVQGSVEMDVVISVLLPIVQIALLDIVLSGDNVGVIALAIRNIVVLVIGSYSARLWFLQD